MIRKLLYSLMLIGYASASQAQEAKLMPDTQKVQRPQPKFWFGVSGAANVNLYTGTTQVINSDVSAPTAFHKGHGVAPYGSLLMEYRPNPVVGLMLNIGYDDRSGKFDGVDAPCNCPETLDATLRYATIEPSLRIAPFSSGFYMFIGGAYSYNFDKSFTYTQQLNPSTKFNTSGGDFNHVRQHVFSGQIGAGYDIPLASVTSRTQVNLSPFVAFHPYFGQDPRSVESWSVSTVRVGIALKFGRGPAIAPASSPAPTPASNAVAAWVAPAEVQFSIISPANIPVERRVRETFPVRNYVFFDLGSTAIPDRYVLLTKDQVKDFKEDQLEVFAPKKLSGRSNREMIVYYNVLNILGDRMQKNPSATITLRGASMAGVDDGKAMAESVKKYLVDVFAINPSRITTEGRIKPVIASEQSGGTIELPLLREGDHRVTIVSTSPDMLMQFQSGPDVPLKPVELVGVQDAPMDSYVTFIADGAKEAYTSWSIEIRDDKGTLQNFGPYTWDRVSIPGKFILGTTPQGDYKVTMVGLTKAGKTIRKDKTIHMVLWTPDTREEGIRYSVIYEFNESKSIEMYKKYLTEVVTPKIPLNATVIVHGHTDIIGDEAHNQALSLARANDVKGILEKSLAKTNRTDVKFEVYGFGEDQALAPFDNKYPEERFYNRTVIIDIVPKK
jgi:hypothetical protein